MNIDLGTLCLIGVFVIVGVMLLSRFMGGNRGGYTTRGNERPENDDPNIQGRGSFGGGNTPVRGGERPENDDPNIQGRGFFGRSRGSTSSAFRGLGGNKSNSSSSGLGGSSRSSRSSNSSSGKKDSPNVKGRGSFGG